MSIIIFRNDLDEITQVKNLKVLNKSYGNSKRNPVILTKRVFIYLIRYYNPHLYIELMNSRSVPVGKDFLPYIERPMNYFLIKHIIEEIPNIIIFPHRSILYSAFGDLKFAKKQFISILVRSMYIRIYFDKGIVPTGHESILSEIKNEYVNYQNKIREIENYDTEIVLDESEIKELYRYFVNISYDMHNYVSRSEIITNLI